MKKKLSRALALLCAFALAVLVLPPVVPAFAEGATSGECGAEGGNVQWNFDAATGTLTLSGTGKMADVEYGGVLNYVGNSAPWGSYIDTIKTISIASGITSIGDFAFQNCGSLTGVTIPDSVTSIGSGAFLNCSNLTDATIPENVTSIGFDAFNGCSSLQNVTIPTGVACIPYCAFRSCSSLTGVTIPASVTQIVEGAFSGCRSLKAFTVDADNTRYYAENGVLYERGSDPGHDAIIQVPPLGVTGTFEIPAGISDIKDYAFNDCANLTSVKIPDSVTSIGILAFSECRSLTSVTIPNSVTSIGDSAFVSCTNLRSITIPAGVTSIKDWTFFNCTNLTSVTIPANVTSIGSAAFKDCSNLTDLIIPDGVTSIGGRAFAACDSLTSIAIPASVTSIEEGAFSCSYRSKLEGFTVSVDNKHYYAENGVLYERGFESGNDVIVQVPPLKATNTFEISNKISRIAAFAFAGCSNMENVVMPTSVTSIGDSAFAGCTKLTGMMIPVSVTNIGNRTFWGSTALKAIKFEGNAPEFGNETFFSVTATAYYPAGNATWTEEVRQQYGGTITWRASSVSEPEVKNEVDTKKMTEDEKKNVEDIEESLKNVSRPDEELNDIYKGKDLQEGDTLTLQYVLKDVKQNDKEIVAFTVDVSPILKKANNTIQKIENTDLALGEGKGFTFRIPVPAILAKFTSKVTVFHNGEKLASCEIQGKNSASPYVEVTTTSFSPFTVQVAAAMPGDANQDGDVDIFDLAAVKSYILDNSTKIDTAAADMTGDGEIDIFDLMQIKRYILNKGQA